MKKFALNTLVALCLTVGIAPRLIYATQTIDLIDTPLAKKINDTMPRPGSRGSSKIKELEWPCRTTNSIRTWACRG